MPKLIEDQKDEDLRRRYREYLSAAGVDHGRVAIEILFMLPAQFVRLYAEIYDAALKSTMSGGTGRSAEEGGIVRAESGGGGKRGDGGLHTRIMPEAKARKMAPATADRMLRNNAALDLKGRLDRRLVKAAEDCVEGIRAARNADGEAIPEISGQTRNGGNTDKERMRCPECGRGMATGWVRCPFH